MDVDDTRRMRDSEVQEFIVEQCGAKSMMEFQKLAMEEQTRIVLDTMGGGLRLLYGGLG